MWKILLQGQMLIVSGVACINYYQWIYIYNHTWCFVKKLKIQLLKHFEILKVTITTQNDIHNAHNYAKDLA